MTKLGLDAAIEAAERWAISDPSAAMRGQIDTLVDAGDSRLVALFSGRIAFGTAGLRAEVGPGPNRMNALVVRQTTYAVVDWLIKTQQVGAPRVVIGFDGRHDSADFAAHAAAAVQAAGGFPLLADAHAPTPVFAHALLAENADAAIVITASHNPAVDNGYKLYLGDGLQLVSPADAEVASLIDTIAANWHQHGPTVDDAFADRTSTSGRASVVAWRHAHGRAAASALFTDHRDLAVAYTPMHGVGGVAIVEAFRSAGFADPLIVEEQFDPDPDFPTVQFPNPEEPGAFDRVISVAQAEGADAAFANDPDADRLAIAVPSRSGDEFVAISGNELGVLLADHVLNHTAGADRLVARSIVSSRQLDRLAEMAGVQCEVTLTGFKWVARPIVTHHEARYVFGFEEAIGYCIGSHVRDKDGITAALVAAEMLAGLRSAGANAWQRLDEIASVTGVYLNHPISVRFDQNPAHVTELMSSIAASPPSEVGGSPLVAAGQIGFGQLPDTAGLHLLTEDDSQVIVRPSGTEPKLKAYIEVVEPPLADGPIADLSAARTRAAARLASVVADVQELLSTS